MRNLTRIWGPGAQRVLKNNNNKKNVPISKWKKTIMILNKNTAKKPD